MSWRDAEQGETADGIDGGGSTVEALLRIARRLRNGRLALTPVSAVSASVARGSINKAAGETAK